MNKPSVGENLPLFYCLSCLWRNVSQQQLAMPQISSNFSIKWMLLISGRKGGGELIREESAESWERQAGEEGGRDTAASVNGCPSETQQAFTRAACAPRKLLKSFISCFWDGRCYTVTIYCYKEPVMLTRPWIVLVSDSRWGETRRESFVTDGL